ncbi:MAG: hypothetical protein ACOYXA_16460 [Bacteroidota bacterium]
MTPASHHLRQLRQRYLLLRMGESILFALALALFSMALLKLSVGLTTAWVAAMVAGVIGFGWYTRHLKLWSLSEWNMAYYLNRWYPEMQDSTDLLLTQPENALQQLQQQKATEKLAQISGNIRLPHRLPWAVLFVLIGFGLSIFLPTLSIEHAALAPTEERATPLEDEPLKSVISQVAITITPPSYTAVKEVTSQQLPLKVRKGSRVHWNLVFNQPPETLQWLFSGRDSVAVVWQGANALHERVIQEPGFYQLKWTDATGTYRSDYYPIEVIPDLPPSIEVTNLTTFVEIAIDGNTRIPLTAVLKDDYAVTNAHIIATVSKGSGESVKFREETLRFQAPASFNTKESTAQLTIDLLQLGLEPGDELYFYVEAFDNQQPVANKTRTETFFIALQDTTRMEAVANEGLGVDLMPEYFRSQRQIIIDSEKLLAEKKKTTKEAFNFRSNELGYDQKVLRLRYGQFMGEEFETTIGPTEHNEEAHDHDEDEDVVQRFGHQHDNENEHNLVAGQTKTPAHEHEHTHNAKPGETENENPLEAFAHNHDNTEEATFFIQSVKNKLRAALTLMWDAELYLRMYQPEKSLPYQYKILKLLKEISNDSRIYVHRTGFDPPPLKEEKRLTGDLTEVTVSVTQARLAQEAAYPRLRDALQLLAEKRPEDAFTFTESALLQQAGNELAGIAVSNPGRYLEGLSWMQQLIENKLTTTERAQTQQTVVKLLWTLVPETTHTPSRTQQTAHPWTQHLMKNLQRATSDGKPGL